MATTVGRGIRHAQHSLKLLLEAVCSPQQRLQPIDELCADDVLNTGTLKISYKNTRLALSYFKYDQ